MIERKEEWYIVGIGIDIDIIINNDTFCPNNCSKLSESSLISSLAWFHRVAGILLLGILVHAKCFIFCLGLITGLMGKPGIPIFIQYNTMQYNTE